MIEEGRKLCRLTIFDVDRNDHDSDDWEVNSASCMKLTFLDPTKSLSLKAQLILLRIFRNALATYMQQSGTQEKTPFSGIFLCALHGDLSHI